MLWCFLLVWKVTWLEEQQPQIPVVLPGRRKDGPRVMIVMLFTKVKWRKKEAQTCWPHLLSQMGSRNSQWSRNGTTTSPGPRKPQIAPLTLWPSELSDMRGPHREATLKTPPLTLHPYYLPSGSGWGLKTLILGPTFCLSWFSCTIHVGYHPKPKKLTKVKSGDMTSPLPFPQTSVCRSMMSWPTRGMVVPVFSHSTEWRSRGEAARGSRSLRTHAGGDCGIPRTPSHGLSRGACCLSCENTTRRPFRTVDSPSGPDNSWHNQTVLGFTP